MTGNMAAGLQFNSTARDVSGHLKNILLTLAVFRQVTCRLVSPEKVIHPQAQELNILKDFLRENVSGHVRELCAALLSNQIGGPGSHLSLSAGVPAQRRPLLELLVHSSAVFHSGNSLLRPLHSISSQPQNMTGAFLPTMPDDNTSESQKWLREKNLKPYYCAKGHLCFVGECGKPMALSRCATCGVPIGGLQHNPVAGFTPVHGDLTRDQTRPGHILGNAKNRSEAPDRDLSLAQSCVLRLCLHLAMLQGAIHHQLGIRNMIQPAVYDVFEFLWQHLEKDMEILGKTFNRNMDDTAIIVHLILNRFLETTTGRSLDLSSRKSREQWESTVCESVISPVLKDLNRTLGYAQGLIASDTNLSNSPLMKVLRGDPQKILDLQNDCPTHTSAFWSPSPVLTVESFSQEIDKKQTPLLTLFITKVHCIRQLIHLPTLAALLSDLMKLLPPGSETQTYTIASLLHSISAGHQKKTLSDRIEIFMKVWNHLRMEIAKNESLDRAMYETDMTKESSGQFLSLSRQGPGSCLHALIDLLSETHNSLVREARKLCHQKDSDYKVPLAALSENQLALCHPERQFLPLVLANCHYTLEKGQQTVSSYDHQAIERELCRRFFAGKPRIQTDTEKYLRRHHQDFSEVLTEVRAKIPQEPLKSSVLSSMRSMLRSFTDVCDAVYAVEIGLRFLCKTGGDPQFLLLKYLQKSLKMDKRISSSMAQALKENRLSQCTATWQLLTCWRSEQMMRREQDPFQRLPEEYRDQLTSDDRKQLKVFLGVTDIDIFLLEIHEILQLKAKNTDDGFRPDWDIRFTLESHLENKNIISFPGLDSLPEDITLAKAAEIWKLAVEFKR